MIVFLFAAFIFAFVMQAYITTIPLVLPVILLFWLLCKNPLPFVLALISGIFIDISTVLSIGQTGLFFVLFLLVVSLYEKKYETETIPFVFFATFIAAVVYLLFTQSSHVVPQAAVASLWGCFLCGLLFPRKQRRIELEYET